MKLFAIIISIVFALTMNASAQQPQGDDWQGSKCTVKKLEVERLPDLNMARASHATFYANGELTVAGGHTDGFVPTATAEYFKDGKWHLIKMTYPHDNGLFVALRSGRILLAGGHSEALGIGQSFVAEMYEPKSHTFNGFSSLDMKRALATGVELDSGVVIAGNHYHDDGIEFFDGKQSFVPVGKTSVDRCIPYILRTSGNNVLILGSRDSHFNLIHDTRADRLHGHPLNLPLLSEWHPISSDQPFTSEANSIGNASTGDYAYLIPVSNDEGQVAVAELRDTVLSLLPTACAVPMTHQGDSIFWYVIIADTLEQRAYMRGSTRSHRHFILAIDYAEASYIKPAPLTLFVADTLPELGNATPVLTPEGNLIVVGGITNGDEHNNFNPVNTAWLLRLQPKKAETAQSNDEESAWPWMLVGICVLAFLSILAWSLSPKRQPTTPPSSAPVEPEADRQLYSRLTEYMEAEKPYLNSELKPTDVADVLSTSTRNLSACVKAIDGISFTQFINAYRVRHAQEILQRQPETKIMTVCAEAGFAGESSFFRIFKAQTGMTPKEWIAQNTH